MVMKDFFFENFLNIFFLFGMWPPQIPTYVHIILFGKLLLLQVMTSNRALLISLIPYFGICFSSPILNILEPWIFDSGFYWSIFFKFSILLFLGQVEKMSDSCFGTLLAKKSLMLSLKLIIGEHKPAWSRFLQPIMPPSRPSKNGNEKLRTNADTYPWFWFKIRLTCCMNHKSTGKFTYD